MPRPSRRLPSIIYSGLGIPSPERAGAVLLLSVVAAAGFLFFFSIPPLYWETVFFN